MEKWIDFHSHILPGIDDGSANVEQTQKLLHMESEQGVGLVIATPHFYANQDRPEDFLKRRARAAVRVRQHWDPSFPRLMFGAEVAYFAGMSICAELPELCVAGTNLLLVEMPFCTWSESVIREVTRLQTRLHLQVLLAHIERYADAENCRAMEAMQEEGILMQSNTGPFLRWRDQRKMIRLLDRGLIHVLGTDTHNTIARPPNLGRAVEVIERKCGAQSVQYLRRNGWKILEAVAEQGGKYGRAKKCEI